MVRQVFSEDCRAPGACIDLGQRRGRRCRHVLPRHAFQRLTEVSRVHHKVDAEHVYDFDMVEYLRNS